MTEPSRPDSYSGFERRIIGPFRRGLLLVTRPLVMLLARLGVHPNVVSASQVVGGFAFLALVPAYPRLAFVLFLLLLLIDGLDGALARAMVSRSHSARNSGSRSSSASTSSCVCSWLNFRAISVLHDLVQSPLGGGHRAKMTYLLSHCKQVVPQAR